MNELEQLYAKRETFTEFGVAVPESLQQQIAEAESTLLNSASELAFDYLPDEIETQLPRFIVAAEYVDGKLCRTGSSASLDFDEVFPHAQAVNNETPDDTDEEDPAPEPQPESKTTKKSSIGFTVRFSDGKTIKFNTAQKTMIESLRYMGLERASNYRGETFKGFPLIGKEKRIDRNGRWQKNIDGWWVYTNMSNSRAVKCITGVAKMLNIPVEVVLDDETAKLHERPKGKRQNFSLNGGAAAPKNRTVYNTVCNLMHEIPTATFKDICDFFPKQLQGSYGVVASLEEIEARRERNRTEDARWFLEPEEILTSADGIRFAVSNEWGNNFADFRTHVEKEFDWTIQEV